LKKIILIFALCINISYANLINAIALIINNEAITLVDIHNKMLNTKLNKKDATNLLIEEMLYKQLEKEKGIYIDIFDVNNYIELLAKQNNMKVYEFKNAIKQQQDYEQFIRDVKKQLKHQKLIAAVANGKITQANDEDLKIYYNNNQAQFQKASKIDLRVYISKDKKPLESVRNNPMLILDNIQTQDITLEDKDLNSKISYILSSTNENSFSSIFINNKAYNMFYITKKYDINIISYEQAKNKIFEIVMKQRQDEFLKDYFETLKLKANIKVLR
jgi:parvulin-like peptidyl-prolyl isomerase